MWRGLRRARACHLLALFSMLLPLASSAADGSSAPTHQEVGSAFAIDDGDIATLLEDGVRVGGTLNSVSDNELALAMALVTTKDLAWQHDRLVRGQEVDPTVMRMARIGDDPIESLRELTLPDDEIDRLAEVAPGYDANFSSEEIAKLKAIAAGGGGPEARRPALMEAFREILAERVAVYRRGGLAALAPYDRGGDEGGDPAGQLERALGELRVTRKLAPAVYEAIANFPAPVPKDVESHLGWVLHDANGRAVVALSHLVFGRVEGGLVAIDRRFYVNHTLNSMQAVLVAMPLAEGRTVVFYANRTGTDLVLGFGSSVARGIGRTIMRREVDRLIAAYEEVAKTP